MQIPTINFLSIPVAALTMRQTLKIIDEAIRNDRHIHHVVINAAKVLAMRKNQQLHNSVTACDLINADGQAIVWAARFLGQHLPERVAGIDLMENLVEMAHQKHYKCFFFGAKEAVVRKVVDIYSERYGQEIIAGYRNGYYARKEEETIARQIGESGANILFVAISSPQKELFLNAFNHILQNINFTMGVGGSFDVVAGVVERAPRWMQNTGMEWLFRLVQEPRRMWRRYLIGNIQFIRLIFIEKFKKTT
ncbi:MAG: WecB/TagA/CpsF family glycosyltransferase [Prevotellaceae bacterium]|jgi:N-acetylglucosaminyldiphosphoundecaprenol N-acetyl-beta-D-mannosaminyltransferase|nr:WecB/TagA/CpsF family glycosyltransferase [Prevotellaceae bacterium]